MIILMFFLVGFMMASWVQSCGISSSMQQSETCPGLDYDMATKSSAVLYTIAATVAVFFTIKCLMFPKKKMHDFSKGKMGY